jgi:hypothetical protein
MPEKQPVEYFDGSISFYQTWQMLMQELAIFGC